MTPSVDCLVSFFLGGATLQHMRPRDTPLLNALREHKGERQNGGIYHLTQVDFAYNSNQGCRLSKEQTLKIKY